jgi:multicomponent Na+:H+ antiporter subunit F
MVESALFIVIIILSLCSVLAIVRFVKGPTLPDRVTAFDLFAALVITDSMAFMDVAILLSLIAFLGAMSFAYFLFRSPKK